MFKYKNINTIIDNDDNLVFNRYKYIDNIPVEDGVVDINISHLEENEYIKTYLSDFKIVFQLINQRNKYEVINYDDSDEIIEEKNNNYQNRLDSIKNIKKSFIYYAINNFKRNKNNIQNIITIVDYYIRMRYYNQYNYSIDTSGFTVTGERYKIISTTDDSKRVGSIYTETSGTEITSTNSVQKQFPLIYEKDGTKYILKSVITADEFNYVLRDILVPVGWDFTYIQIDDSDSNLLFDFTFDSNNIKRLGNAYYFDDLSDYVNDISINNFKNNINSSIEKEYVIIG